MRGMSLIAAIAGSRAWVLPIMLCVMVSAPADAQSPPVATQAAQSPAPPAAAPAAQTTAAPQPATIDQGQSASEIIKGTGRMVRPGAPQHVVSTTVSDEGQITLNFVNADVRDVAKAVLGDFLGLNYAIGSTVQGTVTIQTSRPLGRAEVLPVLEQTLRLNGLALVKNYNVYKIVPIADAPRESSSAMSAGTSEPGYGSEIVPLKFVGATQMQRLLEPMQPQQAIVHADPTRNVLIVEGTQGERAAIVSEVGLFDVDWLAGMSFAMFTPKYTDARGLTRELNQIMGGEHSPLAGIVRIVPIDRLNAVLVISPQQRYLAQFEHWVERLDRPGAGTERQLYVYAVQNGRANDLAVVLKKVLYGNGKDSSKGEGQGDDQSGTGAPPPPSPTQSSGGSGTAATPPPIVNPSLIGDSDNSQPLPNGVSITADESNNAIVVYATPQDYAVIENAMRQLDTVPLQVLLEAVIAEVTLTNDLKYGVQYFYQPSDKHQLTLSSGGATILPSFPGFSYIFSEGTNIKIILDTLAEVTHVEVVSSPEVLVLNNRTATLQVGDQVPIATSQAVSVTADNAPIVNTIQYEPTGVILKVTPRVNQGGMVMMDISQEVSDVASTTTSSLNSPTISQRKIESSVAVQDNETIALGGLISSSTTKGSSGLPFLSEIPVLGGLFGTKQDDVTRTELMVLITPHVVDNLEKARAVTDELRRKLPSVENLLPPRRH
jgi:general secretion pathway protein D